MAVCLCLFYGLATGPAWGRTVTDELGRAVVLGEHPHRIVTLAPSLADTAYSLGHAGDVVGVSDYAFPPEARKKPNVGSGLTPSLETIVSLKPDLVLMMASVTGQDTLRSLERLRLPVFVVKARGIEGAYRSMLSVGNALNDNAAAASLVQSLRAREEKIRQRMAGLPRPSVLLALWPNPFVTAGRGSFITELIHASGARSVTADLPQDWPEINVETIVPRQPKYLLLVRGSNVTPDQLEKLPGWSSLDAVRRHRVLWVDERIYYPSPAMLDAMEELSRQIVAAEGRP